METCARLDVNTQFYRYIVKLIWNKSEKRMQLEEKRG